MNWNERGHVLASCDEHSVYCRVVGIGNMNNCAPFQAFSLHMQERGYRQFILDFSTCEGLDSTFLGILLGIAVGRGSGTAEVVVVNASVSVRRILHEVGIDHLVDVCRDDVQLPDVPLTRLDPIEYAPEKKIDMVLEAHENLCRIDGENSRRFGEFLDLLKGELAAARDRRLASSGGKFLADGE